MSEHLKRLQITMVGEIPQTFVTLLNMIEQSQCQISAMESMDSYHVHVVSIEGPWPRMSHLQTALSQQEWGKKLHIMPQDDRENTPSLDYIIECRSLGPQTRFLDLYRWLIQLNVVIRHCQLSADPQSSTEFQIHFSAPAHVVIRQMKEDFYELCDTYDLEGFLDAVG